MSADTDPELSTRDRLIEAAISIISVEGEVGIKVDRVAALAGFTKPVLYYYFTDREDVIAAAQAELFRRSLEIGLAQALQDARHAKTAREYMDVTSQWMRTLLDEGGEQRRRFRIEVLGSAVSRPALLEKVVEVSRQQVERFASHLQIAESRGWLKPDVDVNDLARWWIGLILSRHMFEIDKEHSSLGNWDAITEFVLRAMIIED